MGQSLCSDRRHCEPWNKGKLVGQKAPLRLKQIWATRIRLQLAERVRELALFNLAVDSKLRSCDLVKLRVSDVTRGDRVTTRVSRAVRDHGADSGVRRGVDQPCKAATGRLSISQSLAILPSSFHASVRSHRARMGQTDRTESGSLWHPHATPYQSGPDLSKDEESQGRAVVARALEARKHSAVPGHRGRRRARDGRADGSLEANAGGRLITRSLTGHFRTLAVHRRMAGKRSFVRRSGITAQEPPRFADNAAAARRTVSVMLDS